MNIVYGIISFGIILYGVYFMRQRAKTDAVIGELVIKPKAQEIKDDIDIAELTKEVADAKTNYVSDAERARREYLATRGPKQ